MVELSLARDFAPADEAAWKALVEEALKGAPFASLRSKTYDGIAIEPLYGRPSQASRVEGRAAGQPWAVMQRIDLPDPAAANKQILDDLNNGANGLTLVFQGAIGDYGYALPATGAAISTALDDIHLEAGVAVDLDLGRSSKDAAGLLATLVKARGLAPRSVAIRFGFNPLGAIATTGESPKLWPDIAANFARLVSDLAAQDFTGPFAVADGRIIHAAGGSEAQELAFALGSAVDYLRALEQGGIALDAARRFIYFRLAADQDQFLTIAKFRAIRKLWARVEEACGLKALPAFVAAETAWRMMTKRDPHGNIVRGTIAALSAAVGGADAVSVLPFSVALGVPDAFARRIARNTQTILIEEANIHRVADAAAGSGAIEALTDALCAKAWSLFQDIERAGGVANALRLRIDPDGNRHSAGRARGQYRPPRGHSGRHQRLPRPRRGSGSGIGPAAAGGSVDPQEGAGPDPAVGAVRAPARPQRRLSRRAWQPAQDLPRLSRPARRISMRGRVSPRACSSRAASKRWQASGDNLAKRFKESGAEARLPVLLRQGL